ncbi:MAG: flagellar basal body P-ring formation protein FlgA [Gammaproteobacteria bacterium]|nr:flagellar basal body P-ring formation protein FlgA [Gammaproteobacteria bacterium]
MKRNFIKQHLPLVFVVFLINAPTIHILHAAQSFESHSHPDIIQASSEFVLREHANSTKIEVSINDLDERLNLAKCSQSLKTFWPPGASKLGRTSVGVECPDAGGWKVYVRASVDVYGNIVVLKEPVQRGDSVTHQNVRLELANLSGLRGDRITEVEQVLNHQFKRPYSSGRPLTFSMVSPPKLVKKGRQVLISYGSDHLQVQMKGIALNDGEAGGVVNVKNISSKKIVQGTVVSRNVVKVSP